MSNPDVKDEAGERARLIEAVEAALRVMGTGHMHESDYARGRRKAAHGQLSDALRAFALLSDAKDKRIADLEGRAKELAAIAFQVGEEDPFAAREAIAAMQRQIVTLTARAEAAEAQLRLSGTEDAGVRALAQLRADGWSVAVHNDYRLAGVQMTFWLFAHSGGQWVKGEGRSDGEAIAAALEQITRRT